MLPDGIIMTSGILVDFDRDGDLDVVAAHGGIFDTITGETFPVYAFQNQGDATFKDVTSKVIPRSARVFWGASGSSKRAGDLNGDGRPDVLFGAIENDHPDAPGLPGLLLLSRKKKNRLRNVSGTHLPQEDGNFVNWVDLGDIDGDGDLDILLGNNCCLSGEERRKGPHLYINGGKGKFTSSPERLPDGVLRFEPAYLSGVFIDAEGDGDLDIFFGADTSTASSALYLNDGAGFFVLGPDPPGHPGEVDIRGVTSVVSVDVDGDGSQDLLLHAVQFLPDPDEIDTLQVFLNDGNGIFRNAGQGLVPRPRPGRQGFMTSFKVADFNNDGLPDIVTTAVDSSGRRLEFFLNKGNGKFRYLRRAFKGSTVVGAEIDVGDLDGDGDIDIIAFTGQRLALAVFRNNLIK